MRIGLLCQNGKWRAPCPVVPSLVQLLPFLAVMKPPPIIQL